MTGSERGRTAGAASFVGIDLAWAPRHPTGLAALVPGARGLEVAACEARVTDGEILAFVGERLADTTVVMVDAPLVVPNAGGMRPCDRLTHVRFGRQHAGAYPANRANMGRWNGGRPRGEALREGLALLGFSAGLLPSPPVAPGRYLFECYPHPAHIRLFGLRRVLKYKVKRQGYPLARREFARYLECLMGLREPRLRLAPDLAASLDVRRAVGRAYKEREDRLDALFCAYLAALVPLGRLEMLGAPEEGSIVVPLSPRADPGGARGGG